jgi:hypothetical protein
MPQRKFRAEWAQCQETLTAYAYKSIKIASQGNKIAVYFCVLDKRNTKLTVVAALCSSRSWAPSHFPFNCLGYCLILFIYLFYCFHIYSHVIQLLGPTLLSSLHPGRTCSTLSFSNFAEEKNIKDNKTAFLLVWDKDSYTERFLALLPCTCVLQPMLVHLYQTSTS